MGYYPTTYKRGDKIIHGYFVYCGRREDGRDIVKRAKTVREAQTIEAKYNKSRSLVDNDLMSLQLAAKLEVVNILKKCVASHTSLTTIYNYWAEAKLKQGAKTVHECSRLFLESLSTYSRRESYIKTMRQFMKNLCDKIGHLSTPGVRLSDLEACQMDAPLKSRQTWRSRACTFFSWCQRKGFCTENVADRLDNPIIERDVPYILSIDQIKTLLLKCPITSLGGLLLMLFCGIRPAEAKKIGWRDISFDDKTITIGAEIAKTRAFRILPIHPNVFAWFKFAKSNNVPLPYRHANKLLTEQFATILDLQSWPRDCLRHTAASMMLVLYKSAERAAMELGNSPGVIHRHYKNIVSDSDCDSFWSLTPKKVGRKTSLLGLSDQSDKNN